MDYASNGSSLQSLLRREYRAPPIPPAEKPVQTVEKESEYEAFSYGRVGIRPQLMLGFRKCNGAVMVRPYAMLDAISTDEENSGFTIDFPKVSVIIQGRNLSKLFRFVCLHRVAEIIEADVATQFTESEENCVVESIDFRKPTIPLIS